MSRRSAWQSVLRRVGQGARNALEIARLGRLSDPYAADFDIYAAERVYKLRRYPGSEDGPALLLVPPLMVTAQVYDIAPEISAVATLSRAGIDVWLCDFGAPELEEGGMERTLDDHVRAVDAAIDKVCEVTGRDIHLAGYSQGGMFCYQAAAYRRSAGLASVITFGSPVDIHRNLPRVADGVASQLISGLQRVVETPLEQVEGLPGILTSTGFKLLSFRKELQQLAEFVVKLHDRQALMRRESRRLFLGGEGFVAWPGPALRKFVEDFIVHNRMVSGGFVIEGRTVSLADIRCPVLCVYGDHDEMARPAAVRAIRRAAPEAAISELQVPAGHFGLVVGSRSQAITWPTVAEWIRWIGEDGPRPQQLPATAPVDVIEEPEDAPFEDVDLTLFVDAVSDFVSGLWRSVGQAVEDAGDALTNLRYQLPRLGELERLSADTQISMSRVLREQAEENADRTFFLWRGRAFSYADADRRVGYVARGLIHLGVRHGKRVGVWMDARPSMLTLVAALNRIGAVAVILPPDVPDPAELARIAEVEAIVVDPPHVRRAAQELTSLKLWCLGGGPSRSVEESRVIDMEQIDPLRVEVPSDVALDAGRARDLAMILFTTSREPGAAPRAARVTNGRWAFSAIGTAAAATLRLEDTVFAALPLHHASGMLVAVGSALVGGCRLALSRTTFDRVDSDVSELWTEVRRYGATVLYYAGDMCRPLVNAPFEPGDAVNPLRLLAGSGMRPEVWRRAVDRFDVGVLEFYASTEAIGVLANASGEKIGALGRPLPGSAEIVLVEVDFETRELKRDARGLMRAVGSNTAGALLVRVDATHPSSGLDPRYEVSSSRIRRNVFEPSDVWHFSGDVVRRDPEGDHWFLGRLSEVVVRSGQPVFSRPIEERLDSVRGVTFSWVLREAERLIGYVLVAESSELRAQDLDKAFGLLPSSAWPDEIRVIDSIEMTDGYRPIRRSLHEARVLATWAPDGQGFRSTPSGASTASQTGP